MSGRHVRRLPSSANRAALLVAAVAAAAIVSLLGLALDSSWLAFAGLGAAIVGAAGFALHLIVTERRRHEVVEEELSAQSSFLESLIESMSSIAAPHEPEQVLDRTRREARELFGAKATLLAPGANGVAGGSRAAAADPRRGDRLAAARAREAARPRGARAGEAAGRLRLPRGREHAAARRGEGARGRAGAAVRPADHRRAGGAAAARALPPRRAGAVALRDQPDARRGDRLARGRAAGGGDRRARLGVASATATRSARCATSRSTSSRSCCATRASGRRCARSPSRSGSRTRSRSTSTSKRPTAWPRTPAWRSTRSSATR